MGKFFAGLIASLLITSVFTLVTLYVANRTVLNFDYLKTKSHQVGLSQELAKTLPDLIAGSGTDARQSSLIKVKIKKIVTADVIQTKLDTFFGSRQ